MEEYRSLGDVIGKIAQDHGMHALLDTQFTMAAWMEIAPAMGKEQELLGAFLECNGAKKLLSVVHRPLQEQQRCIEDLVRTMQEEQRFTMDAARFVCAEFYRGVTNREWNFDQTRTISVSTDLDVYRSVTIKKAGRKAPIAVGVEVDGKRINVHIPARVANGQTICFPQKGSFDRATGQTGDLYLTVRVKGDVAAKRVIGVLAASAVVVAAVVWIGKGGADGFSFGGGAPTRDVAGVSDRAGHTHEWSQATCTQPKACSTCGITKGGVGEHSWTEADCTQPAACEFCGATSGEPLGHAWTPATLMTPKTCTRCNATEGAALNYHTVSVEEEVLSIGERYNAIVANVQADRYQKTNLRKGVTAYYDGNNALTCVQVKRGTDGIGNYSDTYSRSYYFANGKLFFAFFEGSDWHRLYFYNEQLMRWCYTGRGGQAVNYDFSFTDEYHLWEGLALGEIATFS